MAYRLIIYAINFTDDVRKAHPDAESWENRTWETFQPVHSEQALHSCIFCIVSLKIVIIQQNYSVLCVSYEHGGRVFECTPHEKCNIPPTYSKWFIFSLPPVLMIPAEFEPLMQRVHKNKSRHIHLSILSAKGTIENKLNWLFPKYFILNFVLFLSSFCQSLGPWLKRYCKVSH